jgi:nucleotidyltransferase substrate binding protein (TIGR01987 family)
MEVDIRWRQRFDNYQKAFAQLSQAIALSKIRMLTKLEEQGMIQAFEYTFELAWKVLKDYLMHMKVEAKFPREVIKKSFEYDLIDDGDSWLDMLDKRNLMSHAYDEEKAQAALELIQKQYYQALKQVHDLFKQK